MPILKSEQDIFPADLLENAALQDDPVRNWYCLYTLSRREKVLLRKLLANKIACYSPMVAKRFRSPAGRLRTSYTALFPNYVFLYGDESDRLFALQTNCISRSQLIADEATLVRDLQQIRAAIQVGIPLTPEARLDRGQRVRVSAGPFKGFEGEVLRREGKTRLLLRLNFLEQGVSMELDEAVLKPV
jgi:transcription antitermination factor NusG